MSTSHELIEIDYESLPESTPLSSQLLAGAFAGIMEHSIMFPIDAIKTRMQSNLSLNKQAYDGIWHSIKQISSTEGSMALWKGLNSMVIGAGPAHAVYFGTYEFVKKSITDEAVDSDSVKIAKTAVAGASATIMADALMNPFDTIKQRMQLTSMNKSFFKLISKIYYKEGFRSFYYSYPTTITMNIPFAALNFVIYESSTKFFNPMNNYDPIIHSFCGGLSGAIAAGITTPLDNIKTFLQISGESDNQRIRSSNTFLKAGKFIYEKNGFRGFLKGLKPRILSNVPSTAISWTAYEMAKHFLITDTPATDEKLE